MNLPESNYILSLYDRTTNFVKPWWLAGWKCVCIDIQHPKGVTEKKSGLFLVGMDILNYELTTTPAFVFSQQPCTHLTLSGAPHWKKKGIAALIEGLGFFNKAIEICEATGVPFSMENPRNIDDCIFQRYRIPDFTFHPYQYAGYLSGAAAQKERYVKETAIWCGNGFKKPEKRSLGPHPNKRIREKMWRCCSTSENSRSNLRSEAPHGFCRAVWLANDPNIKEKQISEESWKVGLFQGIKT